MENSWAEEDMEVEMRKNRLFGWKTRLTSAALAVIAAAAPVMAAVSENVPGGG